MSDGNDNATRSSGDDGDKIERRRQDQATATRSSDGDEIERRRRDRATATRSSDGDEIECIFSHEADEIERRRGDRATTATRSNDDDKIERRRRDRVYLFSRSRRDRATTGRSSDDGDEIEQESQLVIPDTHGRCQNPASTHLLRSTMIAEYVPFRSDKMYATTQVKALPQLQKTGDVRVSTVSHGFVYEPYALHEKIPWWRRCLYMTSGSLRSLYSTQELAGYLYIICILLVFVATNRRSSDDEEIERGRRRDRARITTFHDTHGRCQNPASTHLLQFTMIAEYVPFSSDKRYATTQVKAPPQLQKMGDVRVSTVLVHDIWVFEKSLFNTGACWRLCVRIEFPSKDIIQPAL
ncbi:hypothetical protein F2Q69_00058636 [Brassica cretica]|uniref:Uncharacterized protein n=1 Tax=Brassica cretica TaxID=69181 RepID=A0A8S9RNE8_BRACR|nr:hypothetical protein F2Q69_00058636 [Brassica cretica]